MATVRKRNWTTAKGEARTAWSVDLVDANGNRERRQFTSKAAADAFRVRIEGQLQKGSYRADASRISIKEVADQFLDYCEARMTRGERMTQHNYKVYEGHVRNYICPDPKRHRTKRYQHLRAFKGGVGHLKLAQLSARGVGDFRDRLRDAGVAVVTTRKILGTLQQLLNFAISRDLIALNVAHGVKVLSKRGEGAKKIVPPTKEAMKQLIAVADEDFAVKLVFASATGVRAGELHALRWHHIDLDKGEVAVDTRVDPYHHEDVTKTEAGMRTVPIAGPVIAQLKAWKLRTKRNKSGDLVFPSRRGWYCGHDNMVKRKFRPLFDKLAKLHAENPTRHPEPPARFNWHALRHFAISTWIEAGLDPKTVQTFAGHSSLQVTMDRYGHLFKSEGHWAAMERIAKAMFER